MMNIFTQCKSSELVLPIENALIYFADNWSAETDIYLFMKSRNILSNDKGFPAVGLCV